MPLSADPDDVLDLWLAVDEQKPLAERPTFQMRFQTERESRAYRRALLSSRDETDPEKSADLVDAAARAQLIGWKNMKLRGADVPYPTPLSEFLSTSEVWELAYAILRRPQLEEEAKKKSLSPSIDARASSAKDAPTPANA